MYQHKIMCVNYTTYDVGHSQNVINSENSHHDIMLLAASNSDVCPTSKVEFFRYAWVLDTFHVNVIYVGPGSLGYQSQRIEFLWVWWYKVIGPGSSGWKKSRLDQLHFPSLMDHAAFDFINPLDVLRGCHVLPRFSLGQQHSNGAGILCSGKDSEDWMEYHMNW